MIATDCGYVRVSAHSQNEARQIQAMQDFGIRRQNIFVYKQSGKDSNHSKYKRIINQIKKDDTLVIQSIDCLERNYDEILEQWRYITKVTKKSRLCSW